jgi:mRNA interferase RelE/StbE
MSKYRIEISATAEKQFRTLPRNDQLRIAGKIQSLAADPLPRGCRKLRGYEDVFRIRVGVLRILYSVESNLLLVIILKVGRRKDVYR